jgi:peptide/nickel transport system permease protein
VLDVEYRITASKESNLRGYSWLRALSGLWGFRIGSAVILFWIAAALFAAALVPHSPTAQDLFAVNAAPSSAHLFGTDQLGRDMFSRVLAGSRSVLIIAGTSTVLAIVVGTAVGLVLGLMRGVVDDVISRILEVLLVLPVVVAALLVIDALGPSDTTVTVTIALIFFPAVARTVRAATAQESQLEYVAAARRIGDSTPYVLAFEVLPNVIPVVIVEFTIRFGYAVFIVATLSFLGFGVQVPTPDWGLDVATNVSVVSAGYWWEVLFPALAITSLVLAINLLADSAEKTGRA